MKRVFLLIISLFFIVGVIGASDSSIDKEKIDKIYKELEAGTITSASITSFPSDGLSSSDQDEFINRIKSLESSKQKSFWGTFWKLPIKDRKKFINSFDNKQKNEALNSFTTSYINPNMKFNLEGDGNPEIIFIKSKDGKSEYLSLDGKRIMLNDYKKESSIYTYNNEFKYDSDTKTLKLENTRSFKDSDNKEIHKNEYTIKGGEYVLGFEKGQLKFYPLTKDGKLNKESKLYGMRGAGKINLDLTNEEQKLSFKSFEENGENRQSSIRLKGMNIRSLPDSLDKTSEIIIDTKGEIKSIEDLKFSLLVGESKESCYYETTNGKTRFISDVKDLLDSKGNIAPEKMKDFLLEGKDESEYSGYFAYDITGGENDKPFLAAVTQTKGFKKISEILPSRLEAQGLDTIGKLLHSDISSSLSTKGAVSSFGDVDLTRMSDALTKYRQKLSDPKEAQTIDSTIKTINSVFGVTFGENAKLSDSDYKILTDNSENGVLAQLEKTVNYFKDKQKADSNYFKKYNDIDFKNLDFNQGGVLDNMREDANAVSSLMGKVNSVYSESVPKSKLSLGSIKSIGTLAVGGNVEVHNGALKITENIDGISFGSTIISTQNEYYGINTQIDKMFTTSSDNIWKISENKQGQLEPFLTNSENPSVEISKLNVKSKIEGEKIPIEVLAYDKFLWAADWIPFVDTSESYIEGREIQPITASFKVTSEEKKRLDAIEKDKKLTSTQKAIERNNIQGPYEISATFHSQADSSDKSFSEAISQTVGVEVAKNLETNRETIQRVMTILEKEKKKELFSREQELMSLRKENEGNAFARGLISDLVKETSVTETAQSITDFASVGYTSYEKLRDINSDKVIRTLKFIDSSLLDVQTKYNSKNGLRQDITAITLIRKENNDLFLKNAKGELLPVDSEIEPFLAKTIPALINTIFRSTSKNTVIDAKNNNFLRSTDYFPPN